MLSAVLFCTDRSLGRSLEEAAFESHEVCIYKSLYAIPSSYEMVRLLETFRPDIVFLELGDSEDGLVLATGIRVICRQVAIVGFTRKHNDSMQEAARKAGVADILSVPFALSRFRAALAQATQSVKPEAAENLFEFLPAKAGSGCTTIALNVAGCLANDLDHKVLVMEGDLRSGLMSVLLKLSAERTILDALQHAASLDGTLWSRIVVEAHGLDLLVSPRLKDTVLVSWSDYGQLLDFIQARYDNIVVDLPELVNDATAEIVRRARKALIVSTLELPSLVLARQRRQELEARGVAKDRIGFVLNRRTKGDIKVEDVEEFLEAPVVAAIQNDYHCVRRAIQEGRLVGRKSELGRAFSALAARLAALASPATPKSPDLVSTL